MVLRCIGRVSFNVLINGSIVDTLELSRGLRQGDTFISISFYSLLGGVV